MSYSDNNNTVGMNPSGVVTLVIVCFVGMLGLMPLAILPLFVGSLIDDFGISPEAAGALVSVNLLGNALGVLVVSMLLRSVGLRQFVYVGVLLAIAAELLSLYLECSYTIFSCIRLLSGIGGGLVTGAAVNWIATRANPDRGFGLLICNQFFLSALLFYMLPNTIMQHGLEAFYWLFIITSVVSGMGSFALLADQENFESEVTEPVDDKFVMDKISIGKALLAIALFEIAASGIWAFVERMGLDWNLTLEAIGNALSIGTLFGIPGSLLVVYLGIRWGRGLPILCGAMSCILGLAIFLSGIQTLWIYVLGLIVFNAAWSFTIPYIQGVQAALDPEGRIAVIGMFVVLLAIALGPFVFGFLIGDRGYSIAIIFACVLLAGCLLSIFDVARRQDQYSL